MNNICVTTENLSKSFTLLKRKNTVLQALLSLASGQPLESTRWVLSNLSCTIKKGERLALLGRNGSGKTTFLRILAGIYDVTGGAMTVNGTPKIMLNSSTGLNANISVMDNIYLLGAIHGIERHILETRSENILQTAGLSALEDSLLRKLSAGQIQRLSLSIFFCSEGDLLIFDEALACVDHAFIKTCDDYFKQLSPYDKTVIITSHNSDFLRKHCTTALWLEEGRVRMHGDFEEVNAAYERSFLK